MPPTHIAILGGGLTGLSAAFHLARRFPSTPITLLEKEHRFGGWVRSERVEVADGQRRRESMVLEAGPRTLRPRSMAVLELIHLLDLTPALLTVPLTAPAARTRFLHLPPRPGLVPLPSSPLSLPSSPLAPLLLSALLREPFRAANRPDGVEDESVDAFLSRRFGRELARVMGSALVHGIYAADSRVLSVRAAFPALWDAETQGRGSVVLGMLRRKQGEGEQETYETGEVEETMKGVSVYTFIEGMETLVHALLGALRQRENVRLVSGERATALSLDPISKSITITTPTHTLHPSHLVSALPLPALAALLPHDPSLRLPHLTANPSASVTVVNLVFPQRVHPDGFGYLVPRSSGEEEVKGGGEGRVLGTVFDSCVGGVQDRVLGDDTGERFTKVTMMLRAPSRSSSPSHSPSTQSLLRTLTTHLSPSPSPLPQPLLVRTHAQTECIPTPTVGHLARMVELREVLGKEPWGGRVEVVGAGVGGVSVGDCVAAGRAVGRAW
ncbi:Protoporphyrinogen oxidase [Gloeophyllum trabeum ATCC 11539]|uniref:Protoporphyrinogen oxidase n=1 Tax=Gloeophyllum trabeum (strain ATCC 11539 / FP-39264 / Madison 617) TaxID=670483 RepID=S7PXN6_GLOTA|nr:Protoporphyrinogen oxidase [Gloeophyllum trabeum ATCC 11539]EPQ52278.1 Protoporphyrinogen oxidase [Gloeophyllum trabeum ATCC 11539]